METEAFLVVAIVVPILFAIAFAIGSIFKEAQANHDRLEEKFKEPKLKVVKEGDEEVFCQKIQEPVIVTETVEQPVQKAKRKYTKKAKI